MAYREPDDIEIRQLLEAISSRYGYDLRQYAGASLRRRIVAALVKSELGELGQFQARILADADFFAEVLEGLTIRVSEMFRDPSFYAAFRSRVVPILRTYPLLKIWHSGCSTGEEAYSSAIILIEEGLYDRAQIYATDLSPQAIEHAKQGIYPVRHVAHFARNYAQSGGTTSFASYYTAAYDRIAIKELVRRNILFFQHNLVSDYHFGEMQVVFCRNVLIYFDRALQERVVEKFAHSLCPGGFLCVGASEQLPRTTTGFKDFDAAERIYRYAGRSDPRLAAERP